MSCDSRQPPKRRSDPRLEALGPWYHDFSRLGLETGEIVSHRPARALARLAQILAGVVPAGLGANLYRRASALRSSAHRVNQPLKETVLVPLLETALAQLGPQPGCLDLFCSDGYYSCLMADLRPDATILGLDLDANHLERARLAQDLLGFDRIRFIEAEACAFLESSTQCFELVFCAGGLYHLEEPSRVLAGIRRICSGYLVLQTVVSLENESEEYFESPAPGWSHGSRFSHARLLSWLEQLGWRIQTVRRNELTGNRRPRDRGSSYVLCLAPR